MEGDRSTCTDLAPPPKLQPNDLVSRANSARTRSVWRKMCSGFQGRKNTKIKNKTPKKINQDRKM